MSELTFFGDDPAPVLDPAVEEYLSWKATFAELGKDLDFIMTEKFGTENPFDGTTIRTYEDAFRWMKAMGNFPDEKPVEKKKKQPKKINEQWLVANQEWRDSIKQRNDAIRKWNEYVEAKRKLFQQTTKYNL